MAKDRECYTSSNQTVVGSRPTSNNAYKCFNSNGTYLQPLNRGFMGFDVIFVLLIVDLHPDYWEVLGTASLGMKRKR